MVVKDQAPYFLHVDERGGIIGITNTGTWKEANLIVSKQNAIRGGHYHLETTELIFMSEGEILLTTQSVDARGCLVGAPETTTKMKGTTFLIHPMTYHKIVAISRRAEWINLLSKAMDKDNPDMHTPFI